MQRVWQHGTGRGKTMGLQATSRRTGKAEFMDPRLKSLRIARSCACRWVALAIYLATNLGISLPLAASKTDVPYPCMHHHCGCTSPEQCWRHCCCMSLVEKLIWARNNRVTPPDYVLAEAHQYGIEWEAFCATAPPEQRDDCCCCRGCCAAKHEHPEASCCESKHESLSRQNGHETDDLVCLITALACRGVDTNSIGVVISLPPPEICQPLQLLAVSELFLAPAQQFVSPAFQPPTPPPRACAICSA
jgi:hypothetical protein